MASTAPTFPLPTSTIAHYSNLAKSGQHLGVGSAVRDRVAKTASELMFLTGEEVVVLLRVASEDGEDGERWLGWCEGVVGLVRPSDLALRAPLLDAPPPPPSSQALRGHSTLDDRISAIIRSPRPGAGVRTRAKSMSRAAPLPPGLLPSSPPETPFKGTESLRPGSSSSGSSQATATYRPPKRQTSLFSSNSEAEAPALESKHAATASEDSTDEEWQGTLKRGLGLDVRLEQPPSTPGRRSRAVSVHRPEFRTAPQHGSFSTSHSVRDARTPPTLPYLAVETPTGPAVQTESYFDLRRSDSPADPHQRLRSGSIASTASAVPTILASPLMDAARTPSSAEWHSPVWATSEQSPSPASTPSAELGISLDDYRYSLLPPQLAMPRPDSDLASQLRRRVESTGSPSPSPRQMSLESDESKDSSGTTPEWTSGESESSASSAPSTPQVSPAVQTKHEAVSPPARDGVPLPPPPPLGGGEEAPFAQLPTVRKPDPLPRTQATSPFPQTDFQSPLSLIDIPRTPQADKRTPKSGRRARTISTPTLMVHTNRALEAATGIPAVPHSPSMQSFMPTAAALSTSPSSLDPPRLNSSERSGSPASTSSAPTVTAHEPPAGRPSLKPAVSSPGPPPPKPNPNVLHKTKSSSNLRQRARSVSSRPAATKPTVFPLSTPNSLRSGPVSPQDYQEEQVRTRSGTEFEIVKPNLMRLRSFESPRTGPSIDSMRSRGGGGSSEAGNECGSDEESDEHRMETALRPTRTAKARVLSELFDGHPGVEPGHSLARPGEVVNEYGFFRPSTSPTHLGGDVEEGESYRLRETQWLSILQKTSSSSARANKKIKKLAKLGVPNSLRGRVWGHLLDVEEYRVPGVWEKLAAKGRLDETYDEIERDLCRTFPDHKDFRDPNSPMIADLRTLLRAFAQYSSQFEDHLRVGYTQGLGVVAGFFLMHSPGEEAFWILVAVVRRLCPGWWSMGLGGFTRDAAVFGKLLEAADPTLAKHMSEQMVDPNMYLTPMFLQLFIRTLPWPTLLRVMDVFVLDGPALLLRVSLAIFHIYRDDILARTQLDVLEFLLNLPHHRLSPTELLSTAFAIKVKPATLAKLRASCDKAASSSSKKVSRR